jgi:NADH:ubiquinone oxidoreductase subunit C
MQHLALFFKLHSLTRATNACDATVVDHITSEMRFQILYLIQSTSINMRFILFTWASETKPVISLQSIFPGFNWAEREI